MGFKPVLVFDLVGTLLDLRALDGDFASIFGDRRVRKEWFSEVQTLFMMTIAVKTYSEFGRIAEAALKIIEQRYEKPLGPTERAELLAKLKQLPSFSDVHDGLDKLRAAGFTLAVLTNSSPAAVKAVLDHAKLSKYFDKAISADSVKRFKPAVEPYQLAARELGVNVSSLMLVAAHSWDIAGASRAGCQTCFVRRPDEVLDEITPTPTLIVADLRQLSRQLGGLTAA